MRPNHPDKENISRLPFKAYYLTILLIATIGLIDSIYLSISHYRVYTEIAYQSFCAITQAINCDTVSQSPYSIFWGVPVPVWGVIGYAFFVAFVILAGDRRAEKQRLWQMLFFLALIFSLSSVALALVSSYLIHSYCIMCIVTYAVNLMLLYFVWIVCKRFGQPGMLAALAADARYLVQRKKPALTVLAIHLAIVCISLAWFPAYWQMASPEIGPQIVSGITAEGHPFIGSENAAVTIIEFADYKCFQCRKMHYYLRQMIAQHPDKVKLIHRHFPLDHTINPGIKTPFHVASGKMALLAVYAAAKDKFWEMNDVLFSAAARNEDLNLKIIAEKTGIAAKELAWALGYKPIAQRLLLDIKEAGEWGISGTPGFVIDGKLYQGNIPAEIMLRIFGASKLS